VPIAWRTREPLARNVASSGVARDMASMSRVLDPADAGTTVREVHHVLSLCGQLSGYSRVSAVLGL
jgi:hypothetical protein